MQRFPHKKHTTQEDEGQTQLLEPWKDKLNVEPLVPLWQTALVLAVTGVVAVAVLCAHESLPQAMRADASAQQFSGERAQRELRALTALGPRVAGGTEAAAAADMLEAKLRAMHVPAHHRIDVERYSGSGSFPLRFLDGFTNVYRGAQSVVARIGPKRHRTGPRPALLLNCHYDTVPDSPGGSDDGAGCAVVMETARALAAGKDMGRDLIVLLNGAEENMMQAAHAWVSGHRWARRVRAFVNVEACGAGGREVLFQAGPHKERALLAAYGAAPRPFASSLAQDIFQSGLLPADTDFRVFRDAGGLSGVDLAWSANGYVYHTALDVAEGVPVESLQRTGENVLVLARELLRSAALDEEDDGREPVFFDVLGIAVVLASEGQARLAATLAAALLVARVRHRGRLAARGAGAMLLRGATAAWGATAAVLVVAMWLRAGGWLMSWYARPWLLMTLYALPAWGVAGLLLMGAKSKSDARTDSEHCADAQLLFWAALTACCVAVGLRSGFLAALWTLPPLVAWLLQRCIGGASLLWWVSGSLLGAAQTWYLAIASLQLLVPITGRAGAQLYAEELMGLLTAVLFIASVGWLYPLLMVTRKARMLLWAGVACGAAVALSAPVWCGEGAAYSATRPQRFMLFHTTRTMHYGNGSTPPLSAYWTPLLDANAARTLHKYGASLGPWSPMGECDSALYCGAPYYLPVSSFISSAMWSRPTAAPEGGPRMRASVRLDEGRLEVTMRSTAAHVSLVVSPSVGGTLANVTIDGRDVTAVKGPMWADRETYFFLLHESANATGGHWQLGATIAGASSVGADVSVAAHCLTGACQTDAPTAALRHAFPKWATVTGWAVDLHLFRV